jgi:hypothetical protein
VIIRAAIHRDSQSGNLEEGLDKNRPPGKEKRSFGSIAGARAEAASG